MIFHLKDVERNSTDGLREKVEYYTYLTSKTSNVSLMWELGTHPTM